MIASDGVQVKVHPQHMAERLFAITQMAFAGCIFMFVGNVMNVSYPSQTLTQQCFHTSPQENGSLHILHIRK